MSAMLDAALQYAANGWRVFPIKPAGKTPLTTHGLKDATTGEATIREWWAKWPTANIGYAAGSGIVVVDIDDIGSWTDLLDEADAPAPNTSRVATAAGWHLFFRSDAPIRNSTGKLRAGIDVRADGGYTILPPSIHESGHVYAWERNGTPDELPAWLLERLTAKPAPAANLRPILDRSSGTHYGRAALEDEAAIVAAAQEGTRRDRLNTAALKLGGLIAGGQLDENEVRATLHEAARLTGLPEPEIQTTIGGGIADGKASPRTAPEQVPRRRDKPAAVLSPETDEAKGRADAKAGAPLTLRGLNTYRPRQVVWLDKPYFQRSAFHLLAGRKGSCKGTYGCSLAARTSNGDLYGQPRRVLVVTSEDSIELDFLPRVLAAGGDTDMISIVVGTFLLPRDVDWLRQKALAVGDVGLIVIDPIGNHLGGVDTDKEGLVRAGIAPLNALADELDCMILGIRHLGKDTSRGALASVLGSTAWVDVPRAVILMAADDEDDMLFHAQVVAGNRGPRKNTGRAFRLELVDVPPATEITLTVPAGESTKDVEALLGARVGTAPESKSGKARELILDVLEHEGEQESDALDARIANDAGIAAKTVQNLRTGLRKEGLIGARPDQNEDGTVARWLVYRTHAPRGDDA